MRACQTAQSTDYGHNLGCENYLCHTVTFAFYRVLRVLLWDQWQTFQPRRTFGEKDENLLQKFLRWQNECGKPVWEFLANRLPDRFCYWHYSKTEAASNTCYTVFSFMRNSWHHPKVCIFRTLVSPPYLFSPLNSTEQWEEAILVPCRKTWEQPPLKFLCKWRRANVNKILDDKIDPKILRFSRVSATGFEVFSEVALEPLSSVFRV